MNEELISKTVIASISIVASVSGLVIMYKKYEERKMAEAREKASVAATEAREKSAGATAIEEIKNRLTKNSEQITDLKEDFEELRKENRTMAKEYLDTLKQLAGKFRT